MANNTIFKLKKSSVPGRVPDSSDLQYGELAINYADGIIYYKNSINQVLSFSDDLGQDHYETINFDSDFASKTTDDLAVGPNNKYYSTVYFDSDLALKTTDDLAEGINKYYNKGYFDSDFTLKTTDDLAEGINKYYSTTLFNTDFATKTSDDLTEGTTNLFYTTFKHDSDFDVKLAAATTDDLAEGVNYLYYTAARVDSDFDARVATKSTSDIAEGTNLYYTSARHDSDFDLQLATKTTDDVSEGTNLYYTAARVDSDIDARLTGTAGINVNAGVVSLDSAHTRSLFSASGDLQYNSSTGEFSFAGGAVYTSTTFDSDFNLKTTDQLSEGGSNLYYTDARFDTRLATKSTSDLTEGTNLYYTTARADSDAKNAISASGDLSYNSGTGVISFTETYSTANDLLTAIKTVDGAGSGLDADLLDGQSSPYYLDYTNFTNTPNVLDSADVRTIFSATGDISYNSNTGEFSVTNPSTTDDIAEGTNLYYTTARADSDAKNALVGGTGITYTAATGTIDIAATGVNTGVYGSASLVPVITINAQGQIDSAGTVAVAGVSSTAFDSSTGVFTINTADGGSYNTVLHDSDDLTTRARNSIRVSDAGGDGSLSYNQSTGVITYTGPSATEVRAHFSVADGVVLSSGEISLGNITPDNVTTTSVTAANITNTSGKTTTTPTEVLVADDAVNIIDNVAHNSEFTSIEYTVHMDDSDNNHSQVSKLLVTYNKSNVFYTEYGMVSSYTGDSDIGTLSADVLGSNIRLKFQRTSGIGTVSVKPVKTIIS